LRQFIERMIVAPLRARVAPVDGPAFPGAYGRAEVRWACGPRSFVQKTVYGLPNFDALDFRTQVSLPLLELLSIKGDTLVWEPVQGHLASWADRTLAVGDSLVLGGNDALGLAVAARNVVGRRPLLRNVPSLGDLDLGPGSLGAALVQFHPEPEVPWVDAAREALLRFLAPGAQVLVNGSSTDLTRFLDRHKGLRKLRDERTKGWRACLLERQTSG